MIDFNKIDEFIEKAPKPPYCQVHDEEWKNALLGARETFSESHLSVLSTESLWSLIFFSAVYFCKGMMWAETKAGLRTESYYPRY